MREAGHWRDSARAYKVLLDDIEVGQIEEGEDKEFHVDPGAHRLRLKIDWAASRELPLTLEPATTATLLCKPGGSAFTTLIHAVAKRHDYVDLRSAADEERATGAMDHRLRERRARRSAWLRTHLIQASLIAGIIWAFTFWAFQLLLGQDGDSALVSLIISVVVGVLVVAPVWVFTMRRFYKKRE